MIVQNKKISIDKLIPWLLVIISFSSLLNTAEFDSMDICFRDQP